VASEHRPKAASDENEENVKIPQIQPDEEFIKTAGINKRPGVPLGLRFQFNYINNIPTIPINPKKNEKFR
jgi:hypothetical protein